MVTVLHSLLERRRLCFRFKSTVGVKAPLTSVPRRNHVESQKRKDLVWFVKMVQEKNSFNHTLSQTVDFFFFFYVCGSFVNICDQRTDWLLTMSKKKQAQSWWAGVQQLNLTEFLFVVDWKLSRLYILKKRNQIYCVQIIVLILQYNIRTFRKTCSP